MEEITNICEELLGYQEIKNSYQIKSQILNILEIAQNDILNITKQSEDNKILDSEIINMNKSLSCDFNVEDKLKIFQQDCLIQQFINQSLKSTQSSRNSSFINRSERLLTEDRHSESNGSLTSLMQAINQVDIDTEISEDLNEVQKQNKENQPTNIMTPEKKVPKNKQVDKNQNAKIISTKSQKRNEGKQKAMRALKMTSKFIKFEKIQDSTEKPQNIKTTNCNKKSVPKNTMMQSHQPANKENKLKNEIKEQNEVVKNLERKVFVQEDNLINKDKEIMQLRIELLKLQKGQKSQKSNINY